MAGMSRPLIALALGFAAIPYLVLGGSTLVEGRPDDPDVPTWVAYVWGAESLAVGLLLAGSAWLAFNSVARWGAVAVTALAGAVVILVTTGLFGLPLVAGLVVLLLVALALRSRTSPGTA
jgi:hypothetical protein